MLNNINVSHFHYTKFVCLANSRYICKVNWKLTFKNSIKLSWTTKVKNKIDKNKRALTSLTFKK